MKRILFSLALLGSIAMMSSCNKDNDDNGGSPSVEDRFTFDGETYEINDGIILDLGPTPLVEGDDPSHYSYMFNVTDGEITEVDGELTLENGTYALQTIVFSAGSSSFSDGTFTFLDEDDDLTGLEDQDLLVYAVLVVDGNGDGDLDDVDAGDDMEYYATGGNMEIEGSGANYSLIYDLQFGNKAVEGGFEGTFSIIDFTDIIGGGDNKLFFNGQEVEANAGVILDFGSNGSHYNSDFLVTDDANFTADAAELRGSYLLYSELFSAGTQTFVPGTFVYATAEDDVSALDFHLTSLYVDADEDGFITENDAEVPVTDGTVTVSEDNGIHTIEYDLELEGGIVLTGSYTGEFSYAEINGRRSNFRITKSSFAITKR